MASGRNCFALTRVSQDVHALEVGALRRSTWSPAYSCGRRTLPTAAGKGRWHNGARPRGGASRVRGELPVELRTYLVEDNATIRENLVETLEELASLHPLGWSDTENEAKLWLAAHRGAWDLVIVDLFLRQGSGLGVLEAARDRSRNQRAVVLSNYATPDMRRRCAELGADAVFDKSNEIDALVDYCLALAARP